MFGPNKPNNFTLMLRILGGGNLIYLGGGLWQGAEGNTLYLLISAFFMLVGAILLLSSLLEISRGGNTEPTPPDDGESETKEESHDE